MSKLTGIFSKNKSEINKFINNDIKKDTIVANNSLAIKIKGLKNKTYYYKTYKDRGWISLGVGLMKKGGKFRIMDKDLWESLYFSGGIPSAGHFMFLEWDKNAIKVRNDSLGVRDLYFYKDNKKVIFSTKIDEIVKLISNLTVDFEIISGDYILSERLVHKTEIKEIKRIGPDTVTVFTPDKIEVLKLYTFLSKKEKRYENISEYFREFLAISNDYKISLGLSGGIDSRILLAYLLRYSMNFTTHSFGLKDDKDNIISKVMANRIGFDNKLYNKFDPAKTVSIFKNFLSFNPFNIGLERIPYYYELSDFGNKNYIFVDGQFGEFFRGVFYKKLKILERLHQLNEENLLNMLRKDIPPIFSPAILEIMQKGARIQVEEVLSDYRRKYRKSMNFADYLALIHHFPNKMARDQARIDRYCLSIMPFAQTELIKSILYPHRRTFSEKIIEYIFPALKHYPFVKNNKLYPYNRYMREIVLIKEKFQKKNSKPGLYDAVFYSDDLKEYIFDEINSHKFKNSSMFNMKFVNDTVNGFYRKEEKNHLLALKYFLSFYMVPQINKLI